MICIFSTTRDQTTTEVMRWLQHFGVTDIIRVNSDEKSTGDSRIEFDVAADSFSFRQNGRRVDLTDIDAVWYRKGRNWICNQFSDPGFGDRPKLAVYLREKIAREEMRLSEYLHFMIENATPTLGAPSRTDLNKLLVLHMARKVGMLTPPFHATNDKTYIAQVLDGKPFITKPIADVLYLFDSEDTNTGYFTYTEEIAQTSLNGLPALLSPSFIQEQIIKDHEVRAFYLDGKCYAMAIFSQRDERTRVDFRRYNYTKPNRAVPMLLPEDLKTQIGLLFAQLKLNTGSVDFLVDRQGRFFFLEINPVGQFSMVSSPCNYFLEKEVARTLKNYANHEE